MSLKDFRTNASDLPEEADDTHISSSLYLKERSELKIDKLSNRVTIISVMLPVLIGAVLFFIYLDIKDQVMDVDLSKKNQVEYLTRQSEEKLNALDMRIAKNRFDLDEKMPLLEKKGQSLENQMAKLAASKADSAALEAGIQRLDDLLAKHDQRINNNAVQDKANLAELERINTTLLSAMDRNRDQLEKNTRALVEKTIQALKQDLNALKERLDTKIIDLQRLQKDLSLMDKLVKDLQNQFMDRKELNQRLSDLENTLNQGIKDLETQMKKPAESRESSRAPRIQPAQPPHTPSDAAPDGRLNPELIAPETISEENLTQ